jgi:hypothetical protein
LLGSESGTVEFMVIRLGGICALLIVAFLPVGSSWAADRAPSFPDFAVTNFFKGKPAEVDLSSDPKARRFRTQLRLQTAEGANFAGQCRLAKWGCGTGCAEFAIVDCKTGKVYFSKELPYATWSGEWSDAEPGLHFRLDSRLLVLKGAPLEGPKQGTFYYLWESNKLTLIRSDLEK